jgi:hypothetical protein
MLSIMETSKLIAELISKFDVTLANPAEEWTCYNDWFFEQHDVNVKVKARA